MTAGLAGAIEAIQSALATVPGIRSAPPWPTEGGGVQYPFAATYPQSGTVTSGPLPLLRAVHNLVVDVHINRVDMGRDVQTLTALIEPVSAALLADPLLGGTVTHALSGAANPLTYEVLAGTWGGAETLIARFVLQVKILQTVTT